ncbi:MAG: ABC-type transport auxiliary lipoprotein family protein [Maricaulaceae bacterium]
MMTKPYLMSALLGMSIIAGGCVSSILPAAKDANLVYRLASPTTSAVPSPSAHIIRVDRPAAPRFLGGTSVVVSPDQERLAVAGGAEWGEAIPDMVQATFMDVLSSRDDLVGILPTSGARTTERVHITIRHFEAQFDKGESQAPLATVQYAVVLSNAANRDLIGKYDIRKTSRADDIRVTSIVDAQSRANLAALNDLADWLAVQLSEYKS